MSPVRPARPRRLAFCAVLGTAALLAAACSSSGGAKSTQAAGSGAGTSSGSATSSCPTANKKLTMGFVYADTTQNPFQEMALGAEAAAKQDGNVDLKESAPTGVNNPQEVSMFQAMARQATDGIAYETV
ncbi:MAG: sugar ABC transporter substrate-binding protein, partial [Actinobacteria bacterium]|nr:sugar ABC transporter substrate-binding protein [Actinomycetota bacterium]